MPKTRVRFVAIGSCPQCGTDVVRPYPCDAGVCTCESVTIVPLKLALVLPTRMYNKFQKIADRAGVSLEAIVNGVLEVELEKLKGVSVKEVLELENKRL